MRAELIDKACRRRESEIQLDSEEGFPMTALLTTNLGPTPLLGRGKVRDLYAVDGALLLVATDRISAFDHVLGTGIPDKGKILTQISLFWFDLLKDVVPNHLITADVQRVSRVAPALPISSCKAARCW
jgi:phosphoribosylaminoimidazole-succinocarboxamide synthase